jgi:hypothetical protein
VASKHRRDVAHDAGTVVTDELEARQARLRRGCGIGPHDGELEPLRNQPAQAALERVGRLVPVKRVELPTFALRMRCSTN